MQQQRGGGRPTATPGTPGQESSGVARGNSVSGGRPSFGASAGTFGHVEVNTSRAVQRFNSYRHSYNYDAFNNRRLLHNFTPLQRFQHAIRLIIILIKSTRSERADRRKHASSTGGSRLPNQDCEAMNLVRPRLPTYGDDQLTFDVSSFKAHRETLVDSRIRRILSIEPELRTTENIDTLIGVMNREIKTFSEFPIHMQRSLLKVATYAFYESDRVIIRQGHRAEHFYLILSGKVVITKMKPELGIREVFVTILGRGSCFGDLALMHGATRSATLTCHTAVELLAVGREDYMDIFMHVDRCGQEPEFISFLRQLDVLRGWNIDLLPYDKTQICMAAYFRRDEVMSRDIVKDDWLYFIKSGSCWVLRQLVPDQRLLSLTANNNNSNNHKSRLSSLPPLSSTTRWQLTSGSLSHYGPATDRTHSHRVCQPAKPLSSRSLTADRLRSKSLTTAVSQTDDQAFSRPIFVRIRKLIRGDSFGLECVAIEPDTNYPRTCLVSCGVEAVLIARRFFQQHLSLDMWKKLMFTIQQYPSNESLQAKLRTKAEWTAYKTSVVDNIQQRIHVAKT